MDLRNIMNNDAGGAARSNPPKPQQSPARHSISDAFSPPPPHEASTPSSYQGGYFARPPQPGPMQQHVLSPGASSSYSSAQSPYQYPSSTNLPPNTVPHHAQSPSHLSQPPYLRESHSGSPVNPAVHGQPLGGPPLASPYASHAMGTGHSQQQSYFPHQTPQPSSTPSRPSPRNSDHSSESPHALTAPPYSTQSISPLAQKSHSGTPLGPPPVPLQRPSSLSNRPASSGRDSQHLQRATSWAPDEMHALERHDSPSRQIVSSNRQVEHPTGRYSVEPERERSVSVSPKTIVNSTPRHSMAGTSERDSPAYRGSMDDGRWRESPPGSRPSPPKVLPGNLPKHGLSSQSPQALSPHQQHAQVNSSPLARRNSTLSTSPSAGAVYNQIQKSERVGSSDSPVQPPTKRKRMRYDEPPIYARKATRTSGRSPVIPNRRAPISKQTGGSLARDDRSTSARRSVPPMPGPASGLARSETNGEPPANGQSSRAGTAEPTVGLLGPWEPSITGQIPYEEVTKIICDFLFQQVVIRKDVDAAPAGAVATGSTAILEVEAKLGQLIDRDRGGRVHLPVLSECVISKDDSGYRTVFESSMSLEQHRAMNNFLNESVKASIPKPGSTRIPLSYAHKKERDTFYEITANELPPIVQHNLHPRHKPKVRVTTDQTTGEIVAKIVKCRIADLDVYSPRTNVDWRVSVNLEMNYDGEVGHLRVSDGGSARGRAGGERNKDRMSYRHLAYQIDLTQVASIENPKKEDFEHELEIEVSAAEIRRQGDLAMAGDPKNQYEALIKGFVDNVRVLARAVPGSHAPM